MGQRAETSAGKGSAGPIRGGAVSRIGSAGMAKPGEPHLEIKADQLGGQRAGSATNLPNPVRKVWRKPSEPGSEGLQRICGSF